MAAAVTSGIAKLNPFAKKKKVDDDDAGEEIDSSTVAGGGHSARQTTLTKTELRVSHALRSYLVSKNVVSEAEAGLGDPGQLTPALKNLLDKPHIKVPSEVTDRSHPLPEYFISSSHNTYLMAHQLYGTSSATAYETALNTGSRCVEIDAWDGDDKNEPKVTHGFTLVSNISFRAVCETIRDVVDKEAQEAVDAQGYRAAPVMISLENHCDEHGQKRLAEIMKEVWGDRLLSKPIRDKGHAEQEGQAEHVRLQDLGSKIVVIVEYHYPDEKEDDSSSSSEDEDEEEKKNRQAYKQQKKEAPTLKIVPELAELGVYAQSVKPQNNSWFESELEGAPHHHLINVSESGLVSHMPKESQRVSRHNAHHLMRVYPKGTRISSANLRPVPYWGVGAQICALNWQTFGASAQINEALFSGSDGYVLKPAALRAGGNGKLNTGKKVKLRLHVAGATDVHLPEDREANEIKPYVSCTLVHPDDLEDEPPKKKTSGYKQHKLGFLHSGENPPATEPVWDEVLQWDYEDNELAFLRILLKSDDSFAANPVFAVAAVRLSYATSGWSFIRMLDLKGRETTCTLLVKFEFVR